MRSSFSRIVARPLLALLGLIAAAGLHAQAQVAGRNVNLIGVNSSNGNIYSVAFPPSCGTPPCAGSTTILNTDAGSYGRADALAFVTNATTSQLDLLVGDAAHGTITRYPGALAVQTPPNPTTGTQIFNFHVAGTGPIAPNALGVDGYGNLFVGSSIWPLPGAQVWEFPVGTAGTGSFGAPVLIDSNFQLLETPVEVAIVPADVTGATGIAGGDLVVLTNLRVLAYSRANNWARTTLLTFRLSSPAPGGMDFWPFGNGTGANYSLLISTHESDMITRYYFTSPLTAAPKPFYSGPVDDIDRLKTLFQAGSPLLFVSENTNHAVLELGANPDGSGNAVLLASTTQNITTPVGLAVSNSFTNAASTCLQPGGCNLTGLLNHNFSGVSTLTGNITENVCAAKDPRVSVTGGVWACNIPYTPPAGFTCPPPPPGTPAGGPPGPGCLPVNAICPGFDDTGKMALPEFLCGSPDISLVKTVTDPTQFEGALINNDMVLADGNSPACGPGAAADGTLVWSPLAAEGTLPFYASNMVGDSSGCGGGHSSTPHVSVTGAGVLINEAAPELNADGLPRPLENYALIKYRGLTTTINSLTQANPSYPFWTGLYPNIAGDVSLLLWAGNVPPASTGTPGCIDQSWADFYTATVVDADGSPQWRADLQNAANMLTTADASGSTSCDGIIVAQLASNPSVFQQTPNATYPNAPTVLNPPGLVRSYASDLYYHLNTRILGNPAPSTWPLPVSVNVLPTYLTLADSATPGSATLSWNTNGDSGCTLSSSDGQYPAGTALAPSPMQLTVPTADAGTIVKYTVTCTTGPAANAVDAYVTVRPPPSLTVNPTAVLQGTPATLQWNTNGAQGCTASSNDPANPFTGSVNGTGTLSLNPAAAGAYTYTMACTTPSTTKTATLTVVAPPTLAITASTVLLGGNGTSLNYNYNGNSSCTWNSTDPDFTPPAGPSPPPASQTGSVTVNPAATGSYTYAFSCTVPGSTTTAPVSLTVVQQPTANLPPPASVIQGTPSNLSWNQYNATGCSWSSNDPTFTAPTASSGSQSVNPTSPGSFTYTLTCAAPAAPATTTLTVVAPLPPTLTLAPASVIQGSTAALQWTINQGDVCTASSTDGSFTGSVSSSGSMAVGGTNLPGAYQYTLTCTAPANTVLTQTLTVQAPQAPTLALTPSSVIQGSSATLQWTINPGDMCTASSTDGSFTGPVSATGSMLVGGSNVPGTYKYTLTCTAPAKTIVSKTLTVRAPLPPTLAVSPSSIAQGSSAKLSWTIKPGDVCTASSTDNSFSGPIGSTGSMNVKPSVAGTYTYTLSCTAPASTVVSTTLTVNPAATNIGITVTGSDIDDAGDTGTLVWTMNGPTTGCTVSARWAPYAVPQFTPFAVSASGSTSVTFTAAGNYTFKLACKAPALTVSTTICIKPFGK